jgi:hypothetical protein
MRDLLAAPLALLSMALFALVWIHAGRRRA